MKIGEISTSTKENLGWKLRCRVIWSACPECGREKWVQIKWFGKLCGKCSVRLKAQPKGASAKKPGNSDRQRGALNHSWKGGRKRLATGYIAVKIQPDHAMYAMAWSTGYVLEHRLIMAEAIGRPLTRNETVHHKNGRKDFNRLSNLELWFGNHGSGKRHDDLCASCPYRLENEDVECDHLVS